MPAYVYLLLKGGTAVNRTQCRSLRLKGITIVLLIICVIASLAVLFERISMYSEATQHNIIPLTESSGGTKVVMLTQGKPEPAPPINASRLSVQASPSFSAYDDRTVWRGETDVDIFRISYDNSSGEMTVNGASENSDKLIAPGTSGVYRFSLENTGNVTLDYTMNMEAWITGTDLEIPVKARVCNYKGEYLLGDAETKEDVLSLNTVEDSKPLGAGRYADYTLEWEWPYEQGNDAYDTLLGNLSVEDELALTIKINTTAMYNDDPHNENAGLNSPQTGEKMPVKVIACIMCVMTVTAIFSCFAGRRRENEK